MEVDDIFLGANNATFRDSTSTICDNDAVSSRYLSLALLEGVCDLSFKNASFNVTGEYMDINHC